MTPSGHSATNKISIPALPRVIPRKALFRKLKGKGHFSATWISAMAGSGKTTLAASFITHQKFHAVWYTLDEGDEDPATFFYYLGTTEKIKALSAGPPLPVLTQDYFGNVRTFAKRFFELLCARMPRPLLLVFDDYHKIPPESDFHEIFQSGISAVPPDAHVVVLSRTDAPPSFARMLANNRMRRITDPALKLNSAESKKMAEMISGKRLPRKVADEIYAKTDGWAAGLVFMAKRIGGNDFSPGQIHALKSEDVYAYFVGEFFHGMPDSEKAFLKKCALVPILPASVAGDITGNDQAAAILRSMVQHHLFTEICPGDEPVFQFHPLFREFLLSEVGTTLSREESACLQCKAGDALASRNYFEEAAHLYHEAGQTDRLMRLIEAQAIPLLEQGRNKTLAEWIRKLSDDTLQCHPWMYYWLGVSCRYAAPGQARAHFETAFHRFAAMGDRTGEYLAWAGVVGSILYEWNDFTPLNPWIDWLQNRLENKITFPSPAIEAVVAVNMMSALLVCRPEYPEMIPWVKKTLALCRENMDERLYIEAADWAITYYSWAGLFAKAEIIKQETGRLLDKGEAHAPSLLHWKWLDISTCLFYDIPSESTLRQVSEALAMAERTGVSTWQPMLLLCGVFVALILEDFQQAETFLQYLEPVVDPTRQHGYAIYLHCKALYYFLKGDTTRALEHAQTAVKVIHKTGYTFPTIVCRFGLSQVLISKGDFEAAEREMAVTRKLSHQTRSRVMTFMCLMNESWSAWKQGKAQEDKQGLEELMRFGREHGFKGLIWWWNPEMMSCLCSRALSAGIETDYCRSLIQAWKLRPMSPSCAPGNWPWPLAIHTFGRFVLRINDEALPATPKAHARPLELLAALISRGGKSVDIEMLKDDLWPDADGDMAQSAFSTTLNRLRKLLVRKDVIQLYNGRLALTPLHCWLDTWAFEEKVREAESFMTRGTMAEAKTAFHEALALYKGPFLSKEPQRHWMVPLRERLALKYMRTLNALGEIMEKEGSCDEAIHLYTQGLETDHLEEVFYQKLMSCYEMQGRHSDAVKTFLRCKEILWEHLGVCPADATRELYERIVSRP